MRSRIAPLLLTWFALLVGAGAATTPPDPALLAAQIDARLEARLATMGIPLASQADDAEFLRRVSLDITGRIPRPTDIREFFADTSSNKRRLLIERLLADPRSAVHFANLWRAELLPEAAASGQAITLKRGFENWLVQRFREEVRYDRLVHELLTVPLPQTGENPEPVLRDPERPNPLAFFAAKESRPENIAAAVTRSFLGIRLECAQCHDHPFGTWKQEQFWSQAAFFNGLEQQGTGLFAPLTETRQRRPISVPESKHKAEAIFLDGNSPQWQADRSPRTELADWLTSSQNLDFARAAVNRIWGQFYGVGLVEPVDDFHSGNPPSDGEFLDDLARAFVASDFDLGYLVRGICLSRSYQRTSVRSDSRQDETRLPARMVVKALTGEQFFDSLALATGYRDEQDKGSARRQFLARFARMSAPGEPETSIQQALTLRNGPFVEWATDPNRSPTLIAVTQMPHMSTADRIEALYLTTLSRPPTPEELTRLVKHVQSVPTEQAERLADVFWLLLNSAEFRLNP